MRPLPTLGLGAFSKSSAEFSLTISGLEQFGRHAEMDIQAYNFEAIVEAIETEMSNLETKNSGVEWIF